MIAPIGIKQWWNQNNKHQDMQNYTLPPSHGVSSGLQVNQKRTWIKTISTKHLNQINKMVISLWKKNASLLNPCFAYPNITAFQSIILLSWGAPLIPAGGSCCNLLKSLINLFLAGVDILTAYNQKNGRVPFKFNYITSHKNEWNTVPKPFLLLHSQNMSKQLQKLSKQTLIIKKLN